MDFLVENLFPAILSIFILWDAVWKAFAMWKSARNDQMAWFVCIALFNTLGILPIIYLLLNTDKRWR